MFKNTLLVVALVFAPLFVFADNLPNTETEHPAITLQNQSTQNQEPSLEDQYQVELVVFRYTNKVSRVGDWQNPTLIKTANAIDLVLPEFSVENQTPNYCLLPTAKMCLNKEEQRLEHNPNYEVMLHIAWTQDINNKTSSKQVHIAGGKNYTIQGEFTNEVEGTVSISKNKFLNLKADLCITEPSKDIAFENSNSLGRQFYNLPEVLSYHFAQSRRMKVGELNYLDNPNFGVLVMVKPIQRL